MRDNGRTKRGRLKAHAKATDADLRFVAQRGKGSHGTVYVNDRFTVLKDRKKEIGKGLLRSMLADLGIDPETF